MNEISVMPLRFRIWDKSIQQMSKPFALHELCDICPAYFDNPDNFIISQDTGLVDELDESIFVGDIIELTVEKESDGEPVNQIQVTTAPVAYEHGKIALAVKRPPYTSVTYWVPLDEYNQQLRKVGNIWQGIAEEEIDTDAR